MLHWNILTYGVKISCTYAHINTETLLTTNCHVTEHMCSNASTDSQKHIRITSVTVSIPIEYVHFCITTYACTYLHAIYNITQSTLNIQLAMHILDLCTYVQKKLCAVKTCETTVVNTVT